MKTFFTFTLLCVFLSNSIQAQTFADPPGPENVLVVYNEQDTTSFLVANYYKTARNIPAVNVIGLMKF